MNQSETRYREGALETLISINIIAYEEVGDQCSKSFSNLVPGPSTTTNISGLLVYRRKYIQKRSITGVQIKNYLIYLFIF